MENKVSTNTSVARSMPAPVKRLQRRRQNAESLYSVYEENVMGITAGFFCAVWAARLMGEHLSVAFTTVSYADTDNPNQYYFGIQDIALAILVTSKLLFVRICILRYLLQPLLRNYYLELSSKQQQQCATVVILVIMRLVSICTCLVESYMSPNMHETVWSSRQKLSVALYTKLLIVVQGSLQITYLVIYYFEDIKKTWNWCKKLTAAFTICALVFVGYFGKSSLAATAVIAGDVLSLLIEFFEGRHLLVNK
ncbi:hypothetical protein COEREDRAFT_79466 [Coemansia reversa NRRL 1564]|uniref:Uncharacterized protein n=1 Tax=Coemansia reversa (strain ATCC 12441 / NRRL 1564) TaxID=763665 RepID=A0A2G5BIX8_COERN|nr:hypothetical protein COEREDRAFT_79466 [Coemansia reversa NRRL 1564]|eukprot:PIA18932.1 hypothetical protein COEREDRAFT_79466 [Coemansia reversa NRRL 1564]